MNLHTKEELRELQAMPLEAKIAMTEVRIHEFVGRFGYDQIRAFVSFSGGKDSTVLLDICRRLYPEMRAVFCNTGLEYPEIQSFAKSHENVDVVRPKMRFDEVISTYGYPIIGKEVAEAIYYARRIRPSERERERERMGNSPRSSQRILGEADNLIETSGARNRRTILQGRWGEKSIGNDWKSGGRRTTSGRQHSRESRSAEQEEPG